MGKWSDSRTKAYFALHNAKRRCYDTENRKYNLYGGRGIKVCDRWLGKHGLDNFMKDLGEPQDGQSIDRIDVDGNYTPENCRWATIHQQNSNRRNNRMNVGVYYEADRDKWRAILTIDKNTVLRKRFNTEHQAIEARDKVKLEYGVI